MQPHPLRSRWRLTSSALLLVIIIGTLSGCAARSPSLDQRHIRSKLDLRLQTALGGKAIGETLGDYIRVLVKLASPGTGEDLSALNRFGTASPFNGAITTMIIEPARIIDIAALDRVVFIELQSPNVPKPNLPPPPPAAGVIS